VIIYRSIALIEDQLKNEHVRINYRVYVQGNKGV